MSAVSVTEASAALTF